jgi:hypothetical protein
MHLGAFSIANYLKRDVSSWLMRKFNPETMKLDIGGGKEINVSHHAVWCAMQIPNAGGDLLPMSDADARAERDRAWLTDCWSFLQLEEGHYCETHNCWTEEPFIDWGTWPKSFFHGCFPVFAVLKH